MSSEPQYIVEGTIISVKADEIILNIGYKADGIVTRNEYTNTPNADLTTNNIIWGRSPCCNTYATHGF